MIKDWIAVLGLAFVFFGTHSLLEDNDHHKTQQHLISEQQENEAL